MYTVSQEMPLQSYQIVSPCENQSDFKAGQTIRFNIPRQVEFFDAHLSRAQFLCRTSGANYKMCMSSDKAGIASMIDMIRISQNGTVISEVQEYATLQHFIKTYEDTLSQHQINALAKGLVDCRITTHTRDYTASDSVLCGQGLNRSGHLGAPDMEQDVKFQMSLDFIGLFEALHVVPSLLLGDILVEIRLAQDNLHMMKVLPATGQTWNVNNTGAGATSVEISPGFVGFTNLADSPFILGQKIRFNQGPTDTDITSLSQNAATGAITIGFAALAGAATGSTSFVIQEGAPNGVIPQRAAVNQDIELIVSKAELQLQVVKPPESYIQGLMNEVESEGMVIDLDGYTTYRNTIQTGIRSQTITLPTTQSRATAVFSVPRRGNQAAQFETTNAADYRFDGDYEALKLYRTQIDTQYYPNAPVDLSQMIGGWHFSQEHLRELEKALDSAGIPMMSCEQLQQNFVLGRALSHKGSSMDLTATPINIYLDYNAQTGPARIKDVVSYLCHKIRILITPMGLQVMS